MQLRGVLFIVPCVRGARARVFEPCGTFRLFTLRFCRETDALNDACDGVCTGCLTELLSKGLGK